MTKRADLSAQQRSTALRPGIRTYKPRRTRMTARESRALDEQSGFLITSGATLLDLASVWGAGTPVVLDLGFGTGSATAQMADADRATGLLAVDVHTPGVGNLLWHVSERHLTNVRVIEGDALAVLEFMIPPASLTGVRTFFPDPWPKARHHKRRVVQPAVMDLVASRLVPGGTWHLATDWGEYATWMQEHFAGDSRWTGGMIPRPDERPVTHYEARALREGRTVIDMRYAVSTGDGTMTP